MTSPAFEKALECFTQALALEPTYAQATAGIALTQSMRAVLSFAEPRQVMPIATEAAEKALAVDETVADAHFALAYVLDFYEWDWARAEQEYRRGLELNPGDTFVRGHYALLLGKVGRADAAIAEARRALELDPLSVMLRYFLSIVLWISRRPEESIVEARAGIELEANHYLLHMSLGWYLAGQGRHDEAVDALRQATALAPGELMPLAALGGGLGRAGQKQEALTILGDLESRRSQAYVSGTLLAYVCLGVGDHNQAISWLQQAAEERDGQLTVLNTYPLFDPLRSDPRFQALLKKMNFPPSADQLSTA